MTNPLAQDLGGVVLLPCPMCGGEAHLERQGHVACTTGWPCVHTAYFNWGTPAEQNAAAIAAWNTRTHTAEIAGALRDAERYRWLRMMAKEQLLNPKAAGSEWPDMRTYWRIPTLICSGPVGGFIDFDAAIDAAMQQGGGGG